MELQPEALVLRESRGVAHGRSSGAGGPIVRENGEVEKREKKDGKEEVLVGFFKWQASNLFQWEEKKTDPRKKKREGSGDVQMKNKENSKKK